MSNLETTTIPEFSMVVLIGASGAGKSTFANKHFLPTEVLSSDYCRALVCDDANSQEATGDAFDLLHYMLEKRLHRRRLTVIDATNVQHTGRKSLIDVARRYHCLPVAIVLDVPESVCHARNQQRPDRDFGPHVVRKHRKDLKRSLKHLKREGFRKVIRLKSVEEIEAFAIERAPLWNDRRDLSGPFDIIGDVHGCFDELADLLGQLGYVIAPGGSIEQGYRVTAPEGRTAMFVGDLVDRGPATPEVLSLVMSMVEQGSAMCVAGNHDVKLLKALRGKKVALKHGLDRSIEQLDACSQAFRERAADFLDSLISHYMLADGALCIAHAGLREDLQGRASGRVRSFALYGDTTGERDELGLPIRLDWAASYRGKATVVYGHTPTGSPEWVNDTICLDTGCVFGGSLSALRWPEREIVSVDARDMYAEPARPLETSSGAEATEHPNMLDLEDVTGKRVVHTTLRERITVQAERSASALEVMSRFAVDPRWLIYLPPTMAPSPTSKREGMLEHPFEALETYRQDGVSQVICEEKHMGSRAVVIALRDPEVARSRFGMTEPAPGIIYTRTGRRFFKSESEEHAMLGAVRDAMEAANLWESLETDWVCLDCELMPWSAKAQALLRSQYAPVGLAARLSSDAALDALSMLQERGVDASALADQMSQRQQHALAFTRTWKNYCWEVDALEDYRLAPFHLLASEGRTHMDRDHRWHMKTLGALCEADTSGALFLTRHKIVDLSDEVACQEVIDWWEELTRSGGEGMVVKPIDFIARGARGVLQPAVKCRGREYLRLIYGLDYTREEHLERLRSRNLGRKRSLALREFALGHEALERFVANRGVRKVHECVFAILALESEPVDPRL